MVHDRGLRSRGSRRARRLRVAAALPDRQRHHRRGRGQGDPQGRGRGPPRGGAAGRRRRGDLPRPLHCSRRSSAGQRGAAGATHLDHRRGWIAPGGPDAPLLEVGERDMVGWARVRGHPNPILERAASHDERSAVPGLAHHRRSPSVGEYHDFTFSQIIISDLQDSSKHFSLIYCALQHALPSTVL